MADFYSLYMLVTLKIMSRTPKSNEFFPPFQQCIYTSLFKIHTLVQNIAQGNPILDISKCRGDLKIKSRSPKSNHLFPSPQQCICASLVKIHQLIQKIIHRNPILDISKSWCELKNKVNVTKI